MKVSKIEIYLSDENDTLLVFEPREKYNDSIRDFIDIYINREKLDLPRAYYVSRLLQEIHAQVTPLLRDLSKKLTKIIEQIEIEATNIEEQYIYKTGAKND